MADASLRNSLLATLAFFDLFDYPLTFAELLRHRYRVAPAGAQDTWDASNALATLEDPAFGEKDGFWFLAGREEIVETRKRRFRLSAKKQKRAKRVAAFLRHLPSVRMVAVCNSLAIANADTESDIDLFVVCAPGTLWTTRLLVVGALAALRLRPDARTHADRVCMSFFVSESCADLSRYALQPDDTYLRYWIATLVPLYDAGGVYQRFINWNSWTHDRLPASRPDGVSAKNGAPHWSAPLLPLFRAADAAARGIQMSRFPAEMRAIANLDSRVVISDDVLKFHVVDRRAEYQQRFQHKLRDLGVTSEANLERSLLESREPVTAVA